MPDAVAVVNIAARRVKKVAVNVCVLGKCYVTWTDS